MKNKNSYFLQKRLVFVGPEARPTGQPAPALAEAQKPPEVKSIALVDTIGGRAAIRKTATNFLKTHTDNYSLYPLIEASAAADRNNAVTKVDAAKNLLADLQVNGANTKAIIPEVYEKFVSVNVLATPKEVRNRLLIRMEAEKYLKNPQNPNLEQLKKLQNAAYEYEINKKDFINADAKCKEILSFLLNANVRISPAIDGQPVEGKGQQGHIEVED